MAFAVKMIVAAVAALALASQVSCKPFAPLYGAPVVASAPLVAAAPAALTTYHAPAVTTYHAPAYSAVTSVAHVPAVATHVASYPSYAGYPYNYYGARYAAAVPAALSTYHYPTAAAAVSYPAAATYGYGYPSGFASTTYHHPYSPYSTTVLHK